MARMVSSDPMFGLRVHISNKGPDLAMSSSEALNAVTVGWTGSTSARLWQCIRECDPVEREAQTLWHPDPYWRSWTNPEYYCREPLSYPCANARVE